MARQPRTRQPKEKFSNIKIYICKRCGRSINDFNLVQIGGEWVTVCSKTKPCYPTPAPPSHQR